MDQQRTNERMDRRLAAANKVAPPATTLLDAASLRRAVVDGARRHWRPLLSLALALAPFVALIVWQPLMTNEMGVANSSRIMAWLLCRLR